MSAWTIENEKRYRAALNDNTGAGMSGALCFMMANFRPVNPPEDTEDNMTSEDIAEALSPFGEISPERVTGIMITLGYRIAYVNAGIMGWSMTDVRGLLEQNTPLPWELPRKL